MQRSRKQSCAHFHATSVRVGRESLRIGAPQPRRFRVGIHVGLPGGNVIGECRLIGRVARSFPVLGLRGRPEFEP
jgi:hypothetical protein